MKRKIHKIVSGAKQGLFALALAVPFGVYAQGTQTYTFTNCGATGRLGPTQLQVDNAYNGTNLQGAVTSNAGIQNFVVPTSGPYRIEVYGASGGQNTTYSGKGAYVSGELNLQSGTTLQILVGQMGSNYASSNSDGGGGGSFVYNASSSALLFAAGGGGGGAQQSQSGSAQNAQTGLTVVNGNATQFGSAAAGFSVNGVHFTFGVYTTVGQSFLNGGNGQAGGQAGGWPGGTYGEGGFGGGGSSCSCSTGGGGGGGGYVGGGGGDCCYYSGFGGSSYTISSAQAPSVSVLGSFGHGKVVLTSLCVPPAPPVSLNSPQDLIICGFGGGITTLSVTGTGDIHWYNVPMFGTALDSGDVFVTPFVTTDTVFYAAATTSCSSDRTAFHLTVLPKPNVSVISSTNAVCQGASVSMIAAGNAVTYTWTGSGSNSPTIVVTPSVSGSYVVNVSAANGCTHTAMHSVIVHPLPVLGISPLNLNTICKGEVVKLQATGAQTYRWSSNMGLLDFGTEIFVSPDVTTTYSVTGTNENGCVKTSTGVEQKVDACVGITELGAMSGDLRIYPNPGKGEFYFEGNFENGTQVVIINVLGQQILTSDLNMVKNLVQIDTKGIYFYQILSNGNKIATGKLVVE